MKFKFECPYCSQRISTTTDQAGTIGVCPACQRDVEVPTPPEEVAPPAFVAMPAPASAIRPAPPRDVPAAVPQEEPPPARPAKPQAAPMRPATRAVPPAPAPRPVPASMSQFADDHWEPKTAQPGLPIFALFLCLIPVPGLFLLRVAGLGNIASFGKLLAGAAGVCLLGLILAHSAYWRSKRRFSARALSFVSLLCGYGSALVMGTMFVALDSANPLVAKQTTEPTGSKAESGNVDPTVSPDAKPKDGEPAKTEPPDAKPKPIEVAKVDPPEKPAAMPEPATMTPAVASAGGAGDPAQFFEGKIHPILSDKCYKCHSEQSGKSKGGLVLDTREGLLKGGETGPGVEPGKPEVSLLIKAVLYNDDNLQMPPKGEKLSDKEIADLTTWVKMGAPYAGKGK